MKKTLCIGMMIALLALLPTLTLGQDQGQEQRRAAEAQILAAELAQVQAEVQLVAAAAAAQDAVIEVQAAPAVELVQEPGQPDAAEPAAEDPADTTTEPAAPSTQVEKVPSGTLRFHLMDGSIITGKLETKTLPVKTEFGDLVVPITKIQNMAPGLDAHPDLNEQIQRLIQQLADPASEKRDRAQAELSNFGSGLVPELQRYTNDSDAERKVRVATLIEQLYEQEDEFVANSGPKVSLVRLDTIVTEQFTVAGRIQQDSFNINSKFGKLVVKLADIKTAERITTEAPEIRRSVDVKGTDMAGRNYKNTGVRVNRGDRIIISAEGRITMSPWGSNTTSGPEGMPQNGMYNGKIPMGALAGRIGDKGEEFKVGASKSFVAQRSGTLYLGFAVAQNWQNYSFPGQYKAKIRVVPASE